MGTAVGDIAHYKEMAHEVIGMGEAFGLFLTKRSEQKIEDICECMGHVDNFIDGLRGAQKKQGAHDVLAYLSDDSDSGMRRQPRNMRLDCWAALEIFKNIIDRLPPDRKTFLIDSAHRIFESGAVLNKTKDINEFTYARKIEGVATADLLLTAVDEFHQSRDFRKLFRRYIIQANWADTIDDYRDDRLRDEIVVPRRIVSHLEKQRFRMLAKMLTTSPQKPFVAVMMTCNLVSMAIHELTHG